MKNRKGQVATILTIGALVVIGITAVISSLGLNKKQSTSTRAASLNCGTSGQMKSGPGTSCSTICSPNTYLGSYLVYPTYRECCCSATAPAVTAVPTKLASITTAPTAPATLPTCNSPTSSGTNCTSNCTPPGGFLYYYCGSTATSPVPTTPSAAKCGSGNYFDCPTDDISKQKCGDAAHKNLEFGCCVRDKLNCTGDQYEVQWYGCTGQPCGNTKIKNTGIGGLGYLEYCPWDFTTNRQCDASVTPIANQPTPTPISTSCTISGNYTQTVPRDGNYHCLPFIGSSSGYGICNGQDAQATILHCSNGNPCRTGGAADGVHDGCSALPAGGVSPGAGSKCDPNGYSPLNCTDYCNAKSQKVGNAQNANITFISSGVEPNTKYYTNNICTTEFFPDQTCNCTGSNLPTKANCTSYPNPQSCTNHACFDPTVKPNSKKIYSYNGTDSSVDDPNNWYRDDCTLLGNYKQDNGTLMNNVNTYCCSAAPAQPAAATCTGLTIQHCSKTCGDFNYSTSNGRDYYYNIIKNIKVYYSDDCVAQITDVMGLENLAKVAAGYCNCGGTGAPICTFSDGIKVDAGKSMCQNNVIYTCPTTGATGTQESCSGKQQICDAQSDSPKCFERNLGKTACYDALHNLTSCGQKVGDSVAAWDCSFNGWPGKARYSTICGTSSPWDCGFVPWDYNMNDNKNEWDLAQTQSYPQAAKANAQCEINANASVTFNVNLTIKNYEILKGTLTNGSICLTNKPKNDICQTIDLSDLNSIGTYTKTFTFTPDKSYKWVVGYLFDNNSHLYQSSMTININSINPPRANGYGLTVDAENPTN